MAFNANNRPQLFHTSIEKLFNNWTALQLAVNNGQGGGYGKEIAAWMRSVVEDFFFQNDNLSGFEVCEYLGQIMNQELDTVVDDNSLEELGERLCQHFQMAMDPLKENDLRQIHLALDADAAGSKNLSHQQAPPQEDDNSSSEEEEKMEVDDNPAETSSSNHRTGHNFVTQPDDEGWVTVVKSKKN